MELNSFMNTKKGERVSLGIGLTLLAFWGVARLHGSMASQEAIERFRTGTQLTLNTTEGTTSAVDFTLWNPKRVAAYKASISMKTNLPVAILRIPQINLEVPVFDNTDDLTLNRGVGRIRGTAQIGHTGNLGIAGHRDGFFRGLKDIGLNDVVDVIRPGATDEYVITEMRVVNPNDISVLAPTTVSTLTLVTCFPFYYIGNAPQRYIITARSQRFSRPDQNQQKPDFNIKKINNKEKQDEIN
jgi:sortase A